MRKFGWLVLVFIVAVIGVANLPHATDRPQSTEPTVSTSGQLDCPVTAVPQNAKPVGTVSFQAGAAHVAGGGSIKVSHTGKATQWQVKGDEGIDLTVYLVEVDSSPGKPSTKLTNFYNNGNKPVTLVDDTEKCTLTLQHTGRKAYPGSGTVKVIANP